MPGGPVADPEHRPYRKLTNQLGALLENACILRTLPGPLWQWSGGASKNGLVPAGASSLPVSPVVAFIHLP